MRGFASRLKWRVWHQFDKWNERHYGIKSSGHIAPEDLGFPTGDESAAATARAWAAS